MQAPQPITPPTGQAPTGPWYPPENPLWGEGTITSDLELAPVPLSPTLEVLVPPRPTDLNLMGTEPRVRPDAPAAFTPINTGVPVRGTDVTFAVPKYGVDTERSHFVRLTGPDGPPGLSSLGPVRVWNALIGTNGLPDLENLSRVNPNGDVATPVPGNLIFTDNNGDIKLWVVGPGGTATASADLPDGPKGPAGTAATPGGRHTHELITPPGHPTYEDVRTRFVGVKFVVGDAQDAPL